jgi:HEAT repeat protein
LRLVRGLDGSGAASSQEARRELVAMGEPVAPLLLEALRSPNTQTRWEAAKALGELALPATAGGLVDSLCDDDGGVRWVAAESLIVLGVPALDALLHAVMKHSEDMWLREAAHHVLTALPAGTARNVVRPVVAALEGPAKQFAVLPAASRALEELGMHRYA